MFLDHGAEGQIRVGLHDTAGSQDIFADHGVPFMGHGAGTDLAHAEAFFQLADFRPFQVDEFVGDLTYRTRDHGDDGSELREAVPLYVPGNRWRVEPQVLAIPILHLQAIFIEGSQRTRRAGQLAHQVAFLPLLQPFQMPSEFVGPDGNLIAQGNGHRMLAVSPPRRRHVAVGHGVFQRKAQQFLHMGFNNGLSVFNLQNYRRVHDVLGGGAPMDPFSRFLATYPFELADLGHQRMGRGEESFTDGIHVHVFRFGTVFNLLCRFFGNDAQFRFRRGQRHPRAHPVLDQLPVGKNLSHFFGAVLVTE